MSTDAKLGLVFGMGLLIAIAVIFFQSDPQAAKKTSSVSPAPLAKTDR